MHTIKKRRISANMSQEEVAKKLNVTQGAVSQWEDGSCMPRADKLLELARLYDCTVENLLNKNIDDLEKTTDDQTS